MALVARKMDREYWQFYAMLSTVTAFLAPGENKGNSEPAIGYNLPDNPATPLFTREPKMISAFFHCFIEHPSDVAAWGQAIGSVVAILIAVWIYHCQCRDTERRSQDEVRAFVQAIREELKFIWEAYNSDARKSLLDVVQGAEMGARPATLRSGVIG